MEIDRRKFLQITGLAFLGLAAKPVFDLLPGPAAVDASSGSPLSGKRWAMAIDIKACTDNDGCVDCISACHRVHNVPDIGNKKEEIKWIWETEFDKAFPNQENSLVKASLQNRSVLTLCNHCDNPPCVRVCPTQATWRRDDGIVMMDYHRCIGCRYCMAACPYGSRSFNWREPRPYLKEIDNSYPARTRGVVEKCNFCEERLADGKMPACVEACKSHALTFGELVPGTDVYKIVSSNFSLRRKAELGTQPQVYYIL
jgi:Fe-S-cluster-containing dehydrogenase component